MKVVQRIRDVSLKLEEAYFEESPRELEKIKISSKNSSSNMDLIEKSGESGSEENVDWTISKWDRKKVEIFKSDKLNARQMLSVLISNASYYENGFSQFFYKIIRKELIEEIRVCF